MTKGLQNTEFMRQGTKEMEIKYKIYKNKLTNILRTSKKEYYGKLLHMNKDNIKGMWKILYTVINKGGKQKSYPNFSC